ncbi:sulfate adenylyltransferase small subunit, partial [Streptomyces chitinivorans]
MTALVTETAAAAAASVTSETATGTAFALSHLDTLESEAVHIFREVAGEF